MNDSLSPLPFIFLAITFLFGCNHQVSGQEKANITTGFGVPELINIGARLQLNNAQLGLSVGSMPVQDEKLLSICIDTQLHFGGSSKLSNRRPWFGRIGFNYLRDETEFAIENYIYLNTRFGRDFNISKKVGIAFDIGALFELSYEETEKVPSSGWDVEIDYPVVPSLGLGLFYRVIPK